MSRSFDLDLKELELIETALQVKLNKLSSNRLTIVQSTIKPETELESVERVDSQMLEINNLLGKLREPPVG